MSAKFENAVRGLEGDVYDLANMANLTVSIVDQCFRGDHAAVTGRPGTYLLTKMESERIIFCAYHLEKMIEAFKDQFLTALHVREPADAA